MIKEGIKRLREMVSGSRVETIPGVLIVPEPIMVPTWKVQQDLVGGYRVSFDGTTISFLEVITSTDQDLFRIFALEELGYDHLSGYSISRHEGRLPEWGVCGTDIWSIGESEDDPGLNYHGTLSMEAFMMRYQRSRVNGYLTEALWDQRERHFKTQNVPFRLSWLRDE